MLFFSSDVTLEGFLGKLFYATSALRKSVGGKLHSALNHPFDSASTLPKAIKLATVTIPTPCVQIKDSKESNFMSDKHRGIRRTDPGHEDTQN